MNVVQLIYLLGSPPALVMPFYYHFTNKWWVSKEGCLFMLMMLLPFGLYASTVLFIVVDHSMARDIVRYILVGLASAGSWTTVIVYHRIRRETLGQREIRRRPNVKPVRRSDS